MRSVFCSLERQSWLSRSLPTNRTVETVDASCNNYNGNGWVAAPHGATDNYLMQLQLDRQNIDWGAYNSAIDEKGYPDHGSRPAGFPILGIRRPVPTKDSGCSRRRTRRSACAAGLTVVIRIGLLTSALTPWSGAVVT